MHSLNKYVVDTSAFLALRGDESGVDRVKGLIARKRNRCQLLVSFISRMEILYTAWREEGGEAARHEHALRVLDYRSRPASKPAGGFQ